MALWADIGGAEGEACRRRILLATIDARLFALDAVTSAPCENLGSGGQIDLTRGIANITRRGEYEGNLGAGDRGWVGQQIAKLRTGRLTQEALAHKTGLTRTSIIKIGPGPRERVASTGDLSHMSKDLLANWCHCVMQVERRRLFRR